jgi:hypothetical protein
MRGRGRHPGPLSPLFRGERVRVRGRNKRRRPWLPLSPTLSPQALGFRVGRACVLMARGQAGRGGSLALIFLTAISWAPIASACTVPDGFARLATPEAEIAYRWQPEAPKVGQFFEAEVIACRGLGPGAVRNVVLDAQMPAHGHGLNYRPTATEIAPGRFRVTGLMLHMPGRWRLTFDLMQGDRRTRLAHEIDLKP